MSEQKPKYVTFRDLHAVSNKPAETHTAPTDSPAPIEPVRPNPLLQLLPVVQDASAQAASDESTTTSTSSTSSTPTPSISLQSINSPTSSDLTSTSTSSSTSTTIADTLSANLDRRNAVNSRNRDRSETIAPEKDFQRVPNSVVRNAIPEGIFRGKSKQVWDYLWSISRGSIIPVRQVRRSRREIQKGSGLGSMVTVDAAIEHLQAVGLIKVHPAIGSLQGNLYEVFTPEEVNPRYTSTSSTSSTTSLTQKVVHLDVLESSTSSTTQPIEKTTTYSRPNTSSKTTTNTDDEAFAFFLQKIKDSHQKLTGKKISPQDMEKWSEVAEVLVDELEKASRRTKSVTSIPAFLAEHLRRRLSQDEPEKPSRKGREKVDARNASTGEGNKSPAQRKMTPEERAETMEMVIELVVSGSYTLEQAEAQFASSFGENDWAEITTRIKAETTGPGQS